MDVASSTLLITSPFGKADLGKHGIPRCVVRTNKPSLQIILELLLKAAVVDA